MKTKVTFTVGHRLLWNLMQHPVRPSAESTAEFSSEAQSATLASPKPFYRYAAPGARLGGEHPKGASNHTKSETWGRRTVWRSLCGLDDQSGAALHEAWRAWRWDAPGHVPVPVAAREANSQLASCFVIGPAPSARPLIGNRWRMPVWMSGAFDLVL